MDSRGGRQGGWRRSSRQRGGRRGIVSRQRWHAAPSLSAARRGLLPSRGTPISLNHLGTTRSEATSDQRQKPRGQRELKRERRTTSSSLRVSMVANLLEARRVPVRCSSRPCVLAVRETWNIGIALWNCSTHYGRASTLMPQIFDCKCSRTASRPPRTGNGRARRATERARAAPGAVYAFNWQNKTALHRPARSRTPGALLTSILGFTRTVSLHPARHSLLLRRPDDTPAYACR